MIILDGVTLSGSLQWSERFSSSGVSQSTRITLGGRVVVNSAKLTGGEEITLVASEDTGWLTKEMVDAVLSRSAVPGLVMNFRFHDELVDVPVVFRHHEVPAVSFSALTPKKAMESSDCFIGTIKLMRI